MEHYKLGCYTKIGGSQLILLQKRCFFFLKKGLGAQNTDAMVMREKRQNGASKNIICPHPKSIGDDDDDDDDGPPSYHPTMRVIRGLPKHWQ